MKLNEAHGFGFYTIAFPIWKWIQFGYMRCARDKSPTIKHRYGNIKIHAGQHECCITTHRVDSLITNWWNMVRRRSNEQIQWKLLVFFGEHFGRILPLHTVKQLSILLFLLFLFFQAFSLHFSFWSIKQWKLYTVDYNKLCCLKSFGIYLRICSSGKWILNVCTKVLAIGRNNQVHQFVTSHINIR